MLKSNKKAKLLQNVPSKGVILHTEKIFIIMIELSLELKT